ncbi:MAG: tetratricopeptide repeat protein [Planctomycetota bacterium]
MTTRNTMINCTAVATLAAAVFLALPGCQGHGKYVQEGVDRAQENMARVKAMTEYDMAKQQYMAGDLDKAIRTVDNSAALAPDVPKVHVLRGRILFEMDRLEDAVDAFDRCLALEEDNDEALYFKGIVHERFTQYGDALEYYAAAAASNATEAQYTLAQAEMLVQLGRLDEAEDVLTQGTRAFEHNAGIRQTLGHIALMQGDVAQAAQLFGEACLLAPADPALIEDLARAQIGAREFLEAEYSLRRLLRMEETGERRDLRLLQARCLAELDRPVEARSILLELVADERGANDVDAWIELGNVALLLEDDFRLRQAASRLMAITPHEADGYLFMAMFERRSGKPEQALQTLESAKGLSDGGSEVALLRAVLYQEMGREDEARRALALALRRNPTDENTGRLMEEMGLGAPVASVPIDDE